MTKAVRLDLVQGIDRLALLMAICIQLETINHRYKARCRCRCLFILFTLIGCVAMIEGSVPKNVGRLSNVAHRAASNDSVFVRRGMVHHGIAPG